MEDSYYNKYLKYKNKYLTLKELLGGSNKKNNISCTFDTYLFKINSSRINRLDLNHDYINDNIIKKPFCIDDYISIIEQDYIDNLYDYLFQYINIEILSDIFNLISNLRINFYDFDNPNNIFGLLDIGDYTNFEDFLNNVNRRNTRAINKRNTDLKNYTNSTDTVTLINNFKNSIIYILININDNRAGHYMYIDNNLNIHDSFITSHYFYEDNSGFCHMTALFYSLLYNNEYVNNNYSNKIKKIINIYSSYFTNNNYYDNDDLKYGCVNTCDEFENSNDNNKKNCFKKVINLIIITHFTYLIFNNNQIINIINDFFNPNHEQDIALEIETNINNGINELKIWLDNIFVTLYKEYGINLCDLLN